MEKEEPERKILKEIMAKKFPNPMNTYKPTDPRNPMKSSIGNVERITLRHITVKLLKVSDTETCRINQRGKKMLRSKIRVTSASSLGLWPRSTGRLSLQHPGVPPLPQGGYHLHFVSPASQQHKLSTGIQHHIPIQLSLLRAQMSPQVRRKDHSHVSKLHWLLGYSL